MRRAWLHLPAKWLGGLSTVLERLVDEALSPTSSRRVPPRTRDRYGSSPMEGSGGFCIPNTAAYGASSLPGAATPAGRMSSPSPTEKASETARCAGLTFKPGSPESASDLLCGIGIVLADETRAALALGEDAVAGALDMLIVAVTDTAEVVAEEQS